MLQSRNQRRSKPSVFRPALLAILLLVPGSSGLLGAEGKQAAPVRVPAALPAPIMHWNFDDADPAAAQDIAGNIKDKISGKFTPVRGVSGKAVRLDGYTFCLQRPGKQVPALGGDFTVDAWVAQGAYPWNWAPVVTQMKAGVNGFYFGVGTRGQFEIELTINDEPTRCVSDDLEIFRKTSPDIFLKFPKGGGP